MTRQISIDTVRDAAKYVYEAAVRTPLVRLPTAPGQPQVYLKLETLQPIGSFKIRGAYNAVRRLTPGELGKGVWTVSAGNAAQGVALAAQKLGARSSVLVMDTAPQTKLRAIRGFGATIVQAPFDECWRAVEEHRSDRMQGHFVHPFDDDHFISGNGTAGLEILEDLPDVDAVIAPLGGGGLLAGIACVMRSERPEAKIYAAEPETAAPLAESFAAGQASTFAGWQASFVDGAGGRSVLASMWPLLRDTVVGIAGRLARRSRKRHAAGRRTYPRDCRGGCGLRHRRGALPGHGRTRPQEGRGRRLGRQYRFEEVCRNRRRLWLARAIGTNDHEREPRAASSEQKTENRE